MPVSARHHRPDWLDVGRARRRAQRDDIVAELWPSGLARTQLQIRIKGDGEPDRGLGPVAFACTTWLASSLLCRHDHDK